jgi:hypothetical protein
MRIYHNIWRENSCLIRCSNNVNEVHTHRQNDYILFVFHSKGWPGDEAKQIRVLGYYYLPVHRTSLASSIVNSAHFSQFNSDEQAVCVCVCERERERDKQRMWW